MGSLAPRILCTMGPASRFSEDSSRPRAKWSLLYSEVDPRCAERHALVTDGYRYIFTPKNHSQALIQNSSSFFRRYLSGRVQGFADGGALRPGERSFRKKRNLLATKPRTDIAEWLDRLRLAMVGHMNLPRYWPLLNLVG